MPRLAERQSGFYAALLDRNVSPPAGLLGPDGQPSTRRFGVYRNNVAAGLAGVLKDAYPAVCRIVGEEFFLAMARLYALASPPVSPILLDYGGGFPDFIAGFEPAAMLPYLADVARIERAWNEAYHSREMAPLTPSAFAEITGGEFAGISFVLHPSLRIVRSRYPALTIWRMNVDDGVPGPVDLSAGENALVVRPAAEVEVRTMPLGGAEFVEALRSGLTVSEAARLAIEAHQPFDLKANLIGLIGAQVFVGYGFAQSDEEAAA
jgi:Putative DNA-binding domain